MKLGFDEKFPSYPIFNPFEKKGGEKMNMPMGPGFSGAGIPKDWEEFRKQKKVEEEEDAAKLSVLKSQLTSLLYGVDIKMLSKALREVIMESLGMKL